MGEIPALPYRVNAHWTFFSRGHLSLKTDTISRKSSNVIKPFSLEQKILQIRYRNGFVYHNEGIVHIV